MIFALFLATTVNLLPNGNFDAGLEKTEYWEDADGLTSFWVDSGGVRERVLKLDSRPEQKQVTEWQETRKSNPRAKPPPPIFAKAPYFSAVGGIEGVAIDSEMISIKKGQFYKLSVDVKGKSNPFVWIKGFRIHPRRKTLTDSYQTRLEVVPTNDWKTYSIGFNPTLHSPHTEMIKVRIYVYWPVGVCYFDNIRIEEITADEMAILAKQREFKNNTDSKELKSDKKKP